MRCEGEEGGKKMEEKMEVRAISIEESSLRKRDARKKLWKNGRKERGKPEKSEGKEERKGEGNGGKGSKNKKRKKRNGEKDSDDKKQGKEN